MTKYSAIGNQHKHYCVHVCIIECAHVHVSHTLYLFIHLNAHMYSCEALCICKNIQTGIGELAPPHLMYVCESICMSACIQATVHETTSVRIFVHMCGCMCACMAGCCAHTHDERHSGVGRRIYMCLHVCTNVFHVCGIPLLAHCRRRT